MARKCENNWCTKFTTNGCLIPEAEAKCPFMRMKIMKDIVKQADKVRTLQSRKVAYSVSSGINEIIKKEEAILDRLLLKYKHPIEHTQEELFK